MDDTGNYNTESNYDESSSPFSHFANAPKN
jgi:hypothetical protein